MTTSKKEYGSIDAAPVVLYAKTDGNSIIAYPVIANTDGTLRVSSGFAIPAFDKIILSYSSSTLTGVVYYLGSPSVATLTLAYTGSNLTLVTKA